MDGDDEGCWRKAVKKKVFFVYSSASALTGTQCGRHKLCLLSCTNFHIISKQFPFSNEGICYFWMVIFISIGKGFWEFELLDIFSDP
jgi:hypothetical protein